MIYCFDTSALNALHDDSDRMTLVKRLLVANTICITAINVIEASGEKDEDRRRSLLALMKELAQDLHPLAIPNDLLKVLAVAYAQGDPAPVISITEEQGGVWRALTNPARVGEHERQEVLKWKTDLEDSFREAHQVARPGFQSLFGEGKSDRIRSVSELIRQYSASEQFLFDMVAPMYHDLTGKELPRSEIRQFLTEIPHWSLYLAGWGHAIYSRAVRDQGYGHRGKPGTIDLWCAVYLPHCDCFVTNDRLQRQALRVLNLFNPRKTRILSYQQFRKQILE